MKRAFILVAGVLAAGHLASCEKANTSPVTSIEGKWLLVRAGGGITGVVDNVPASYQVYSVFGSDSAYALLRPNKPAERSIYHLRSVPGAQHQQLRLKDTNSLSGAPYYKEYIVFKLTPDTLHLETPGGCPLVSIYARQSYSAEGL